MSGKEGEEKGRRSGGGEGGVMDLLSKRASFFEFKYYSFDGELFCCLSRLCSFNFALFMMLSVGPFLFMSFKCFLFLFISHCLLLLISFQFFTCSKVFQVLFMCV